MGIPAIENAKLLKKYGEILDREGIAKRIIEICKKVAEEENYKEAVKASGRIKALAMACKFDHYWEEKMNTGYWDEFDKANYLIWKKESGGEI